MQPCALVAYLHCSSLVLEAAMSNIQMRNSRSRSAACIQEATLLADIDLCRYTPAAPISIILDGMGVW